MRAILLMVGSMAGFAFSDMFVKIATGYLPTGQIIATLGFGGTVVFSILSMRKGHRLIGPDFWHWSILFRMLAEVVGTIGFVVALSLTTLSEVSAVMQAAPLAVTLGAAVVLREPVGWRRWGAVLVGFCGVLIMLQPGAEGMNWGALVSLLAVVGLSSRDLVTRFVPNHVPNLVLATYGFVSLIPTGFILLMFSGGAVVPAAPVMAILFAMVCFASMAYFALTLSLRLGSMAVIAPFRYSRLIFAFALGAVVFGDALTPAIVFGALLVAAAGLYTLYRERRLKHT
ncbi:DMT family transporter [Oceaniglobus ichthyenteri]|uniref:DMT family transporter n=1 Tax=Oceaniglobus ichthyenteri TaxID=2136177 RepID=UPI0013DDDE58|nr:DMT family transporter [Oceaniglobus ichthyenteri]